MSPGKFPSQLRHINLAGHCPFCLKKILSGIQDNESANIKPLSFLWRYLRFGDRAIYQDADALKIPDFSFNSETDEDKDKDDVDSNVTDVPSICRTCLEEVKILKGVHQDLVVIRTTIKEQLKRVQRIILQTEKAQGDSTRDKFEKLLRADSSVKKEDCIRDTVKFLDYIRSGVGKREAGNATPSGPVYPLTTCELLVPVESELSRDEQRHSPTSEITTKLVPEVKVEQASDSDMDDFDNSDMLHESLEEKEDSKRKSRPGLRKRKQVLTTKLFDAPTTRDDSDSNSEDERTEEEDPEFIPKNTKGLETRKTIQRISSTTSTLILRNRGFKSISSSSETPPPPQPVVKRGRGRPRKVPLGTTSSSKSKVVESKAPEASVVVVISYTCDDCDSEPPTTFTSEEDLIRHKVESHGLEIPHKCTTCEDSFYTQNLLQQHERSAHPETISSQTCDICNKTFSSKSYVEHHKKVQHFKEKPYGCEKCDKRFTSNLGLKLHTKAFHLQETFECCACSKVFRFQHLLDRHQENFHPQLPEVVARLKIREERIKGNIVRRGKPPKMSKKMALSFLAAKEKNASEEVASSVSDSQASKDSNEPVLPQVPRSKLKRKIDPKRANHTCDLCPNSETFYKETHLILHKERVHGIEIKDKIKCNLCPKSFVTPSGLRSHLKEYHPGVKVDSVRHNCDQCNRSFSTPVILENHKKIIHQNEVLFKCDECQKVFQNALGLHCHFEAIHRNVRFSCDICKKSFKYQSTISRHKAKVHKMKSRRKEKEKPQLTCSICVSDKPENVSTFRTQDSLQYHCIVTHGADPIQCPSCEEKFLWRNQMLNHVKKVHEGVTETRASKEKKTWICTAENCGKVYLTKENWKTHLMKKHDPDWPKKAKPYVCEFCAKSYIHREAYKAHLKLQHRYSTPTICEKCGKSFKNPQYLRKHMQSHTNQRNFHCPSCPARFKMKHTCDKHIKFVHNTVKQRNVGIRRMHYRPYEGEEGERTEKSVNNPGTSETATSSSSAVSPSISTREVKVDGVKEKSHASSTSENMLHAASLQNMYGYGFMNL